jgi:Tat protein secretion system quality control protein TatD with DNase activity
MAQLPSQDVLHHIIDVHCHPTDAPTISPNSMDRLQITICAMSTMQSDQQLVRDLATSYPTKVVPCFGQLGYLFITPTSGPQLSTLNFALGYHPWFSYLISTQPGPSKNDHYQSLFLGALLPQPDHTEDLHKLINLLPDPIPLGNIISGLRHNLEAFPEAMLGEVGLDRIFRVPFDYYANPRQLTPFTIPLDHQLEILEAQIDLAVELGRNVSFHSVKSQLATADFLKKLQRKHGDRWSRISIDMHSCGLSPETWRDMEACSSGSITPENAHERIRKGTRMCFSRSPP